MDEQFVHCWWSGGLAKVDMPWEIVDEVKGGLKILKNSGHHLWKAPNRSYIRAVIIVLLIKFQYFSLGNQLKVLENCSGV